MRVPTPGASEPETESMSNETKMCGVVKRSSTRAKACATGEARGRLTCCCCCCCCVEDDDEDEDEDEADDIVCVEADDDEEEEDADSVLVRFSSQ